MNWVSVMLSLRYQAGNWMNKCGSSKTSQALPYPGHRPGQRAETWPSSLFLLSGMCGPGAVSVNDIILSTNSFP